jgi:hypothetical protein
MQNSRLSSKRLPSRTIFQSSLNFLIQDFNGSEKPDIVHHRKKNQGLLIRKRLAPAPRIPVTLPRGAL